MLVYDLGCEKRVKAHEVHFKEEYGYNDEKVAVRWSVAVRVFNFECSHGGGNGEKEGRSNGAVGSPLLRLLEDVFDLGMHDLGS